MNLAPGNLSGYEVCSHRTKDCFENCLYYAGYGYMPSVINARMERTVFLFEDRETFMLQLMLEITLARKEAIKLGYKLAIRLNGTSDIPWEDYLLPEDFRNSDVQTLFDMFPNTQFYDYTKVPIMQRKTPDNYHLTYSWGGHNRKKCLWHLANGWSVAIPYHGKMPEYWEGYKTVDGDKNDLRFLDPPSSVVMLKAKGKLRTSDSPFVIGERIA